MVTLAMYSGTVAFGQVSGIPAFGCPQPPDYTCPTLMIPQGTYPATQCQPPQLSNGYVLPSELYTWVNCDWQPDRRPAVFIDMHQGSADRYVPGTLQGSPRAQKRWWRSPGLVDDPNYDLDDQDGHGPLAELLERMDHLYEQGFRRFILQ
jgi:hypothetical protein